MNSIIYTTASRLIVGLMLLFSLFLLWRGHNEPGGGFIGGLVASAGLIVYLLGEGPTAARQMLRVAPKSIAAAGLAVAMLAGLLAAFADAPFLTGLWLMLGGEHGLKLGTPLLFDVGVYLAVVGGVTGMVIALEEPA